jgi:hypothetical protein
MDRQAFQRSWSVMRLLEFLLSENLFDTQVWRSGLSRFTNASASDERVVEAVVII